MHHLFIHCRPILISSFIRLTSFIHSFVDSIANTLPLHISLFCIHHSVTHSFSHTFIQTPMDSYTTTHSFLLSFNHYSLNHPFIRSFITLSLDTRRLSQFRTQFMELQKRSLTKHFQASTEFEPPITGAAFLSYEASTEKVGHFE